ALRGPQGHRRSRLRHVAGGQARRHRGVRGDDHRQAVGKNKSCSELEETALGGVTVGRRGGDGRWRAVVIGLVSVLAVTTCSVSKPRHGFTVSSGRGGNQEGVQQGTASGEISSGGTGEGAAGASGSSGTSTGGSSGSGLGTTGGSSIGGSS